MPWPRSSNCTAPVSNCAAWSAKRKRRGFGERSLQARQAELQRSLQTAEQQIRDLAQEEQRAHAEAERLSDAAAQGGLQDALERKTQCEQHPGPAPQRSTRG